MATADVVREAALYLEYFLKGLSECNVVGSYAVQFLELRSFSVRLEASLAGHLVYLLINMKGLLMKLDSSLIPYTDVGVQTDGPVLCSVCNNQSSLCSSLRGNSLQGLKPSFEETVVMKSCESPEISQLLGSTPMIQLKQEIPCMNASLSTTNHRLKKDSDNNVIPVESPDAKEVISEAEQGASFKSEKCSMALPFQTPLDNGLNIEYASTSQLEEEQEEILLDHDESDAAQSEGLIYSIYTMSACGSLQLVSRVLSKNSSLKDNVNEPVEKAMIEINNLKEELGSQDPLETLTLHNENIQDHEANGDQEIGTLVQNLPVCQGKSLAKISTRTGKSAKPKRTKTSKEVKAYGSMRNEVLKLGPEDLGKATWCDICEKEFPSLGSLKAHVSRTHSKVKWCNTCNKTIDSEEMNSHVRDVHSDLPYVCDMCGQSLRTNGALQRHLDIHKGLRGSACEVCGQTFSRTEYYQDHKRIHTGEKPFKCETCKKTFTRSSNLYTHMRIHNGEEQRHSCKLCSKSFARADKLKEHAIRHSLVKRYSCRLCTKSYRERRDLIKHLGKIHANDRNSDPD